MEINTSNEVEAGCCDECLTGQHTGGLADQKLEEVAITTIELGRISVNLCAPCLLNLYTQLRDPLNIEQPSPTLEHVIVSVAKQRLSELKSYAEEYDSVADIHSRFSELTGLTELAKLQDNGLSEVALKKLDDIDTAALSVMRDLAQ